MSLSSAGGSHGKAAFGSPFPLVWRGHQIDQRGDLLSRITIALSFTLILSACAGNAFSLEEFQCFNEPDEEEVFNVEIVDCDENHDLEIYRIFDIDGGTYDATVIDQQALDLCLAQFDGFIGTEYATSDFEIYYLQPTEESWDDGDREVVCAVYDLAGEHTTGSARNIGR